jgi:hypothetical protein
MCRQGRLLIFEQAPTLNLHKVSWGVKFNFSSQAMPGVGMYKGLPFL